MIYEETLQSVDSLLKAVGIYKEGVEQSVRLLMHHLLAARAMYEEMSEQERRTVARLQKKLRDVFDAKCELKERKRKQRKENTSPAPLPKEKENKEKEQKNTHTITREASENDSFLEARREAFKKECEKYVGKYNVDEVTNFFYYWSDDSRKQGLMRWEMEKTWRMENRLKRWMKNSNTLSDAAAKIRLEQVKGKGAQQDTAAKQQQVAAQVRKQQEAIEARKDEEMKANRQSIDDYIRQNPDSLMAKMYRETHKT